MFIFSYVSHSWRVKSVSTLKKFCYFPVLCTSKLIQTLSHECMYRLHRWYHHFFDFSSNILLHLHVSLTLNFIFIFSLECPDCSIGKTDFVMLMKAICLPMLMLIGHILTCQNEQLTSTAACNVVMINGLVSVLRNYRLFQSLLFSHSFYLWLIFVCVTLPPCS